MEITRDTAQGPREYQEDRSIVYFDADGSTLLGIFDGHSGFEAVTAAALKTATIYETLRRVGNYGTGLLEKIIERLDKETAEFACGTTASLVWLPPEPTAAYVAILGDSPVLIKSGDTLNISPEHNVRTNTAEADAALERGGFIHNGYLFAPGAYSGIQMSRVLGDKALRSVTTRVPEVYRVPVAAGDWILLGSDGLLDPAHLTTDANAVIQKQIELGYTASDLVLAKLYEAQDNVTAILARI